MAGPFEIGHHLYGVHELEVMQSPAGWYLGTSDNGAPNSRETGYWATRREAQDALNRYNETGQLINSR